MKKKKRVTLKSSRSEFIKICSMWDFPLKENWREVLKKTKNKMCIDNGIPRCWKLE